MKADRARIERAVDRPSPEVRCILLYGPDESGSRALGDRLGRSLGSDVERVDLTGPMLKGDPARLADEAASISLFGSPRLIRVESVGDESLEAVRALLEAGVAGNPVVLLAGALRKDSKLVDLLTRHDAALVFASYPIEGADGERLAFDLARSAGVELTPDLARRIADAAGGDRGVLAHEIEKFALFLDAAPDRRRDLNHAVLDVLSADGQEGDLGRLVDAVVAGDPPGARNETERLASDGIAGITTLRAVQRRLLLLAQLRAEVDAGNGIDIVMNGAAARAIFWRDKKPVARQVSRWTASDLAAAIDRVGRAEREAMASRGPGPIAVEVELAAVARYAARRR